MGRFVFLAVLVAAFCGASLAGAAEVGGLGRTWEKLSGEKKLTIGYFGGSITEGGGASSPATCWRALTTGWFQSEFPAAEITEINAGIGGTGSDLGAFRCQRDLLSHSPDLVFVEFAVNDLGGPDTLASYYEGIIRQIRKANPATDIVLVYTVNKAGDVYPQGGVPHTVAYEQKIADHYGLPSVNVGKELSQAIQDGRGTWETLTRDATHPTDVGHRLYADAVIACLQGHRADAPGEAPALPAPLYPHPAEDTAMIDAWTLDAPGWSKEDASLAGRFPHRLAADQPGTEWTYAFHGTGIGLYWLVAPDSGAVDYAIDQEPLRRRSSWDSYALKMTRANYVVLSSGLSPGDHVLHVRISDQKDPASTGNWIRLGALLLER